MIDRISDEGVVLFITGWQVIRKVRERNLVLEVVHARNELMDCPCAVIVVSEVEAFKRGHFHGV